METRSAAEMAPLRARAQSGVGWFYWIAGLSLVNSIAAATGSTWGFMAGLGVTQMVDGMAQSMGPGARPFALAIDVVIAGLVVAFGAWASRNSTVYLVGMIAYAVDALLFALVADWISLAFHGLVLFFLWRGWSAQCELARHPLESPMAPAADVPGERAA